jgi:hypothetical protein
MDIFEPIREILMAMTKEEKQPSNNLEHRCGIISSCYPPNELYPQGHRVEYPFAINPNDIERYERNHN